MRSASSSTRKSSCCTCVRCLLAPPPSCNTSQIIHANAQGSPDMCCVPTSPSITPRFVCFQHPYGVPCILQACQRASDQKNRIVGICIQHLHEVPQPPRGGRHDCRLLGQHSLLDSRPSQRSAFDSVNACHNRNITETPCLRWSLRSRYWPLTRMIAVLGIEHTATAW